jgi:hypothetical protein
VTVPGITASPPSAKSSAVLNKMLVIGSSGSGKTCLAKQIADRLSLPFFPSDDVFWSAGWQPAAHIDVARWLRDVLDRPTWVIDGNFDRERASLWMAADLIVWLDYPWLPTLWRVARRNIRWWALRRPVWGQRRLTLRQARSGIRHAARSHGLKRRAYPSALAALNGVDVITIHSARELRRWLSALQLPARG